MPRIGQIAYRVETLDDPPRVVARFETFAELWAFGDNEEVRKQLLRIVTMKFWHADGPDRPASECYWMKESETEETE